MKWAVVPEYDEWGRLVGFHVEYPVMKEVTSPR